MPDEKTNVQKLTLRDRMFRCNQCGNVENRDTNAANVVLDRCTVGMKGIEALGVVSREI